MKRPPAAGSGQLTVRRWLPPEYSWLPPSGGRFLLLALVMTMLGVFAGGVAVARYGLLSAMVIGAFAGPLSNLLFIWLAMQDHNLIAHFAAIGLDNVAGGFAGTCLIAYMSSLTSAGFTATQYALFSSLYAIPGRVLASQSGRIVEGAGLGDSARAALISRGLAEMSRFVAAHGGDAATVTGLSGLGDLVLTGTSHQSRNLRFGIELGRHGNADGWSGDLVEGAFAAGVASRVAAERNIDMPITDAVAAIIDGKLDLATAIGRLMTRPITQEF